MASTKLTQTKISNTYQGILHANGEAIPASGLVDIYDGVGNKSSLRVGRACNGVSVCGTLSADNLSVSGGFDIPVMALLDRIYPVGSIYMSFVSTSPSTLLGGGTWTQISQGRFLVGVGTGTGTEGSQKTMIAGNNAGEYQHELTTSEIPSHRHDLKHPVTGEQFYVTNDSNTTGGGVDTFRADGPEQSNDARYYPFTNYTGGGNSHNNTPPSYGVYIWRRTA